MRGKGLAILKIERYADYAWLTPPPDLVEKKTLIKRRRTWGS